MSAGIGTALVAHVVGDLTQRGGYTQARLLLDLPEPPTAIFASSVFFSSLHGLAGGAGLVMLR